MPREILSTNAPLSAAGSAAQLAHIDEDHPGAFMRSAEADHVRPKFRVVADGVPVIKPVVEGHDYRVAAGARDPDGEVLVKDWAEDWPEDLSEDQLDSFEVKTEARMDDGGSKASFRAAVENGDGRSMAKSASLHFGLNHPPGKMAASRGEPRRQGLKKPNRKQIALDWPPTPRGCEWRRSDEGLNLWRCWTDWNEDKTKRIKKSRYAGHLSDEAWRIMKEYDHEAFISIVGERLRRHSGR
ncbi:MAG TPA: hypothetical protein VFV58_16195 [Blastocatellia bacterium]|jgi:hypothetical protein|nr:hypothetical protein [Blastocatellia bacterium]